MTSRFPYFPYGFSFALRRALQSPAREGTKDGLDAVGGHVGQAGAFILGDFFFLCPRLLCTASVIITDWGSGLHILPWRCLLVPPHLQASVTLPQAGISPPLIPAAPVRSLVLTGHTPAFPISSRAVLLPVICGFGV